MCLALSGLSGGCRRALFSNKQAEELLFLSIIARLFPARWLGRRSHAVFTGFKKATSACLNHPRPPPPVFSLAGLWKFELLSPSRRASALPCFWARWPGSRPERAGCGGACTSLRVWRRGCTSLRGGPLVPHSAGLPRTLTLGSGAAASTPGGVREPRGASARSSSCVPVAVLLHPRPPTTSPPGFRQRPIDSALLVRAAPRHTVTAKVGVRKRAAPHALGKPHTSLRPRGAHRQGAQRAADSSI